eukprot:SAG22_NODE_67_length_22882_cov_25.671553_17_plen_143_part_00
MHHRTSGAAAWDTSSSCALPLTCFPALARTHACTHARTHAGHYQEGVWINQKLGATGFWGYHHPTGFGFVNLLRIISCTYALYCLVYFYKGTHKLLAPEKVGYDIQTLYKFLSIKLVVFATFWQVRPERKKAERKSGPRPPF